MDVIEIELSKIVWIDEAVNYDNVASVGAAYDQLIEIRKMLDSKKIKLNFEKPILLNNVTDFDTWVRSRYKVFSNDPLHPLFNES